MDAVNVTVNVLQPPTATLSFPSPYFTATLANTAAVGTVLAVQLPSGAAAALQATVPFPSARQPALYNISSSQSPLPLALANTTTPLLVVTQAVDPSATFFDLLLTVVLSGNPLMTASCHVSVTVLDLVPKPPVLSRAAFAFNVSADATAGTSVGRVTLSSMGSATDVPVFSLAAGSAPFFIHFDTGVVVVKSDLGAALVGNMYVLPVTVANTAFTLTTNVSVMVVSSALCMGVLCNQACYTGGYCVRGLCVYTGIDNTSAACTPAAAPCRCPTDTSDQLAW